MRKIKASKIENMFHQLSERRFQRSISDKFLLLKNQPFHIFQQILIRIILHALHCILSNFLYLLVIVYQKIRSNPAATLGESPSYLYFYQPDQIWLASISKIITERELITFRVSISFICSKWYFDLRLHIVGCRPETAEANCSTSKIDDLSLPQINSREV